MSQVQNLLDMFRNSRKDAQAQAVKAPESKSTASKAEQNLLPLESVDRGNVGAPAPKSFQAKVAESRAKLAARTEHTQNKAPEAKPVKETRNGNDADRAQAKRNSESERNDRNEQSDRNERADRAAQADRSDRSDRADDSQRADRAQDSDRTARGGRARIHSRKAAADTQNADDQAQPSETETDGSQTAQDAQALNDHALAQDPAAKAAADLKQLKDGLAKLGIKADDARLQDPSFLSDVLQMLQTLPAQTAPGDANATDPSAAMPAITDATAPATQPVAAQTLPDTNTVATPAAGTAANTDTDATTDADAGQPGPSANDIQNAPAKDAPVDRRELAALIRNRIDALTKPVLGSQNQTAPIAGANLPSAPAGWQGLKLRTQSESAPTQPMPMADLDRMRVLQAAAFQAGNAGKEAPSVSATARESDSVEPVQESGTAAAFSDRIGDAGEHDNAGGSNQDADMSGKNGDAFLGSEASAPKDGLPAAKDISAGTPFQNNLEQARSVEHSVATQRAWEPRPAFEPSALEQIAKKMSAIAHKSGEEINIQLSPEHLGKVNVSLEMKDGAMSARIRVENEDVRQQVEASISTLKDALENQGIKLQGMEVSVDQRHGSLFNPDGSNSESFFQRNNRGGQGNQQSAEVAPFESAPESDTGRRLGYNTMEYIG